MNMQGKPMFILPAALPMATTARSQGTPIIDGTDRPGEGSQAGSFADHARRDDDAGEARRHATEGEDSSAAPPPGRDAPALAPRSDAAAAPAEDESQPPRRAEFATAGSARDGVSDTAERGAPQGEGARMPSAGTALATTRDAMFTAAPNGAATGDTAAGTGKDPTRHGITHNPAEGASGIRNQSVHRERPDATPFTMSSSAQRMVMGEQSSRPGTVASPQPTPEPARTGRIDAVTITQPVPEPTRPETPQRASPLLHSGFASGAATASQMHTAPAADATLVAPAAPQATPASPLMAMHNLTGEFAHGAEERNARFLSALSAMPPGEGGSQAMIGGMESVTPARGVSAAFEAGPGKTQEAGRALVDQILPALQRSTGGRVELTLSPAELGRVEITLQGRDGGMSVSLNAERPETLELLRRHIELLAADMRQLGMTDLSFSFGRESTGDSAPEEGEEVANDGGEARARAGDRPAAQVVGAAANPRQPSETARMDLRL